LSVRITIITPTLNRRGMLAEALDSVARQNWPDLEHIVVDGGSTDGTLEWLGGRPDVTLLTGSDHGVYDAINKGLARATGEIIGILNSDDYYIDRAFQIAADQFCAHPEADVLCGRAVIVDEAGTVEGHLAEPVEHADAIRAALAGICIPNARFFRAHVFNKVGVFDAELRLVADRDFILRLLEEDVSTHSLNEPLYVYRRHPGSLTFDVDRAQALVLRGELLKLAAKWSHRATASPEMRRLAGVLEGRSRIGTLRDAAGRLSVQEILSVLILSQGRFSPRPAITMVRALADWIVTGRNVC
jgi:glycosyltransferase involved in cell wall biosynthesis